MLLHDRSFGSVIRQRRIELGLTQANVALELAIRNINFVDMIETGKRSCPLDHVPRLANVLRLDQLDLCMLALHEEYPRFYAGIFGDGKPPRPRPTK